MSAWRTQLIATAVFVLKWALAGLAFAGVLMWLRPDLRQTSNATTPTPAPLVATASIAAAPARVEPAPLPPAPVQSYADAVARAAPAVVYIYTERRVNDRRTHTAQVQGSLGSGVIVDTQGHVVTNDHLIEDAQQIRMQLLDGRQTDARVVGRDPDSDLALLKIDLPNAPAIALGRSDRLRVGDVTLAIGYPYGLSQTVTHGIVSGVARDLRLVDFENFIQTDAAINVGNSGGALINAHGELIGIATAVLNQQRGSEGLAFAIPVEMVRGVTAQLQKYGRVKRGWLGVDSLPITPQRARELGLKDTQGAQIVEVFADSPAAQAGLQVGDVIVALNGKAFGDNFDAMKRVASLPPGTSLKLRVRRGAETLNLEVKLSERQTPR